MKVSVSPSRIVGSINAPQSKSHAIRYIFCSTMVPVEIRSLVLSNDVVAAIEAVRALGIDYADGFFLRKGDKLKIVKDYVYLGGSATALRMFIPIALAIGGRITIDGDESLRRRPLGALIDVLKDKGINFSSTRLPLTVEGKLRDTSIEISGSESSQYISGFMMAFAIAGGGTIRITPPIVSRSYIYLTASVLRKIGVNVEVYSNRVEINIGDRLSGYVGEVPGDYLLASFYVSSALLTGGRIEVRGLPPPETPLGDHIIVDVYRAMGAYSTYIDGTWFAEASEKYRGIHVDVEDSPDMALSIVPLASVANGVTVIENVSRLRIKESDRISEVIKVLKNFGIDVYADDKSINVSGGRPRRGEVVCPNDHRIAMMATPIALRVGGTIDRAECVKKSNPDFWSDLVKLGGKINIIEVSS